MIFGSIRVESFVHPDERPGKQSPKYARIDTDIKKKVELLYKLWLNEMISAHAKGQAIRSTFKIVGMESEYDAMTMINASTIEVDPTNISYFISGQFQLGIKEENNKTALRLCDLQAPFKAEDISSLDEHVGKFCEILEMSAVNFESNFEYAMATRDVPLGAPRYI